MTDEQINAAIHDALGNPIGCPRCSDPACSYNQGLNYCNDLNAMHEAEKVLTSQQEEDYFANLRAINGDLIWYRTVGKTYRATARQRAEAFLRTLGKWQEATDKESLTVGGATAEQSSADQTESTKVTWRNKYMRDPELADSIIQTLKSDLAEAEKRIEMLTYALERIRDIEWSQYSNRIDAIQELAKQALK
jgi:hypothetical protein